VEGRSDIAVLSYNDADFAQYGRRDLWDLERTELSCHVVGGDDLQMQREHIDRRSKAGEAPQD
jgi:hypothetical protein